MCGYFCTGFYVKRQKFVRLSNLFSPNNYEKNEKIILKYFE